MLRMHFREVFAMHKPIWDMKQAI